MTLITPGDVQTYSVFPIVQNRPEYLLTYDIAEAESEIFSIVNHDFSDGEKYPTIPEAVELACMKLAQYYALLNADESEMKRLKSEKIGDYTYQRDGLQKPDVSSLLQPYIQSAVKNGVRMRLRTL